MPNELRYTRTYKLTLCLIFLVSVLGNGESCLFYVVEISDSSHEAVINMQMYAQCNITNQRRLIVKLVQHVTSNTGTVVILALVCPVRLSVKT